MTRDQGCRARKTGGAPVTPANRAAARNRDTPGTANLITDASNAPPTTRDHARCSVPGGISYPNGGNVHLPLAVGGTWPHLTRDLGSDPPIGTVTVPRHRRAIR